MLFCDVLRRSLGEDAIAIEQDDPGFEFSVGADGRFSIAEKLRLQPVPIYLRLKGVKFVKPPEVVSRQPGGSPTVPAALRPRTELILENSKR